jgi:hypothetical protein
MDGGETFVVRSNSKNRDFITEKVVIATTIDDAKRLVHNPLYQHIHGQSFIRIYGKVSKSSSIKEVVRGHTVVEGPLNKIIPINPDTGVYMIAYADNKDADYLNRIGEDRDKLAKLMQKALGVPVTLTAVKSFYWKIGTHFYDPLPSEFKTREAFIKKAQEPCKGVFLVGEMVALKQGWTEGALESVEKVFTHLNT